ncbi:MAG: GNAT family N-acetyltransferase [Candidatus Binatia bacterium]
MAGEDQIPKSAEEDGFPEKRFYLDEFHEKTLFFALAPGIIDESGLNDFLGIARELIREDARVIVMVSEEDVSKRLEQRFRRLASTSFSEPLFPLEEEGKGKRTIVVETRHPEPDLRVLLRLWSLLRAGPIAVVRMPDATWERMARGAGRLGARLKVHKLVLMDPEGGVRQGPVLSFLDEEVLATLLAEGEAEWSGLGHRRDLIRIIRDALLEGVPSINLCALEGLARELYTYEGSGTLFTLEDYCRVERLGIDDFREVERLLERGQREGFLKIRSPEEIGAILFTGFGATIGAGHLAGVGSLLCDPYEPERLGEIVALYTISRFKGEGVGTRLLARLLADARQRGLRAVFACTTEEGAMQFFVRSGFRRGRIEDVPEAKWRFYDADRVTRLAVFWKDLETPACPPETPA